MSLLNRMPNESDFRLVLDAIFQYETIVKNANCVEIESGKLHKFIGGYPGTNHRMPICCSVMRAKMQGNDEIISEPPKGNGASLKIKYVLPRNAQ